MIGTDTGGTMRGFLTNDFNRTGRDGIMTDIGKGKELGASRAINLDHNTRGRNSGIKGNRSINTGRRFSNISNRGNSSKNNIRLSSPRSESRNLKLSNHRDNLKFNNQATNNRMRKVSSRRAKSRDHRPSNHNALSLTRNLKEGRKNIEIRMTMS
jgi:hypothetical protein